MTLSFDAPSHTYLADGKKLPSTTGILRDCGLTGSYDFRDRIHAYRGTAVHEGAAIIIHGAQTPYLHDLPHPLDKDPKYVKVHSEIPSYWEAVARAKEAVGFEGTIYECRMIDAGRGYAGTFDFGAWSRARRKQLWDIKSGIFPILTVVQICAYEDIARYGQPIDPQHPGFSWLAELVRSGEPFERCGLRLEKTGRFTVFNECPKGRPYSDPMWMAAWRSCLFLHTNIPDHEREEEWIDDYGNARKRSYSMLSDLNWVHDAIEEHLTGPVADMARRAGDNLWNLRESYRLIGKQAAPEQEY